MTLPITKPKPFCFVLMPFDSAFADIYEYGIKGACSEIDVYCERVDEQIFMGSMLDRIFNQIARADVIIADMTGRNPNVFYEVGYAHALGKTVILLTQKAEDIPFDLKHFPHIVYGAVIKELRVELAKRIKYFAFEVENKKNHQNSLELYMDGRSLAFGDVKAEYYYNQDPNALITVHNSSARTYNSGDFSLGVITPHTVTTAFSLFEKKSDRCYSIVSRLPDGQNLHVLQDFDKIFPNMFLSIRLWLRHTSSPPVMDFDVILRLFSADGYRDFPLGFNRLKASKP